MALWCATLFDFLLICFVLFSCKKKKVCLGGYYGQDCEFSCGKCKNETFCNGTNGDCHYGCQENWLGSRCDSKFTNK